MMIIVVAHYRNIDIRCFDKNGGEFVVGVMVEFRAGVVEMCVVETDIHWLLVKE